MAGLDPIEEVKRKTDVVDLVSSYVSIKKSGRNYKGLCPFHNEKTPSFMVSPQLQIFKCFGCGAGGDVLEFYSQIEGVPFSESLKELARRAGVKLASRKKTPEEERREKIHEINRLAADYFHYVLTGHKLGKPALEFLKKRGVSSPAIEEFKLGYAPSGWDNLGRFILKKGYSLTEFLQSGLGNRSDNQRGYYDFFRGRVVYPLRSSTGKFSGFAGRTLGDEEPKYINTTDTPVFEKKSFLFNFDLAKQEIKKQKTAVLVEGEMDAIALYEAGIKNAVATKGTALTPEQIAALARFAQKLILCFDRDAAGLEATKKGIFIAQSAGFDVRAVLLPEGKDPDEAVREDPEGFKKMVEKAPAVFDFYLESALARADASTPSGKKAVAAEILPVLKSLANEVEKAAYIAVLSQKIGISETVLWKQMEKEQGIELDRGGSASAPPPKGPAPLPSREAYLLVLLFTLPEGQIRGAQRKVALEDLASPQSQALLTALREYLKQIKRFRLENFSGKLDKDLRGVLGDLVLSNGVEDPLGEFLKVLESLKRTRFKGERKELLAQLKQAEKDGKSQTVRKLQKQIMALTEKIDR